VPYVPKRISSHRIIASLSLTPGARLGPYEIVGLLGAGGMGEVYRARDTKLGRDVALKLLPDSFAGDAERLARFQREAHVLAALNHPHIGAIYGLDEAGASVFLVLELVDGGTLAETLAALKARGSRMPIDDVLAIARQVAEALEAAHERGVVHRDLKPANIALTAAGRAKVLDFGLAKALDPAGASDLSKSPTLTFAATQAGVILGTAAYMSPEQAKGRTADKRSDVWSFGCVLYEMLAGRRAFEGEDVPDTLAAVLRGEPDWTALPASLPSPVRALVEGCLKKDRRQRIGDISTALFLLDQPPAPAGPVPATAATARRPVWWLAAGAAAAIAATAALTAFLIWRSREVVVPAVTRFTMTLPAGQQFTNIARRFIAISPDGTLVAYVADQKLQVRAMADFDARTLTAGDSGTPSITLPAFSPDGRSLAYYSVVEQAIKRLPVAGGAPVTVCGARLPYNLSWGSGGLVFDQPGGVLRVSPNGGTPETLVTTNNRGDVPYGAQMLPDGETLMFSLSALAQTEADRWDKAQVVVQRLKTGERHTVIDGGSDAQFVGTGHVVYVAGGVLFAVPFDLATLKTTGSPVPVVEGIGRASANGVGHFSFSESGSLIYIPGPATATSRQSNLALIHRKGAVELLGLPPGAYQAPRWSPDGRHFAVVLDDGKEAVVSIHDVSGASSMRRLTFGGNNRFPIWSADGARIAFQSDRDGDRGIFWQQADGSGVAERLTKAEPGASHLPDHWSSNGETLLFSVLKDSMWSTWTFSARDRKITAFDDVNRAPAPNTAMFSPDGRWVVYSAAGALQRMAVYVQPFPPTGAKYQVSKDGEDGHHPVWTQGGKEIVYVPGASQIVAASVTTAPSFVFSLSPPIPSRFTTGAPSVARTYDISPDGSRFLGITSPQRAAPGGDAAQINVVLNWFEELRQRVPVK